MKSKYFKIQELVSPDVYLDYKDRAWLFIDHKLIETLDILRGYFKVPITVNDWLWGGEFTERGLRENTSSIVTDHTDAGDIYISAHVLGKAADFDVKGYTAHEVRQKIIEIQDYLPYNIRLEDRVDWVHLDVFDIGIKVKLFKP